MTKSVEQKLAKIPVINWLAVRFKQLKLPGMADTFYRERVDQHLKIGLLTMTLLRDLKPDKLHSRKLRSFNEVAFQ